MSTANTTNMAFAPPNAALGERSGSATANAVRTQHRSVMQPIVSPGIRAIRWINACMVRAIRWINACMGRAFSLCGGRGVVGEFVD